MERLPDNKLKLTINEFLEVCTKKSNKSIEYLKKPHRNRNKKELEILKMYHINTLCDSEEAITEIRTSSIDRDKIVIIDLGEHFLLQIKEIVACSTLSEKREFNTVGQNERSNAMAQEQSKKLSKEEWIRDQKAKMTHEVTGKKISDGLTETNANLEKSIAKKANYIKMLESMTPEARDAKIRDASLRDAKNEMTNGKYKKTIAEIADLKKIEKPSIAEENALQAARADLKTMDKVCKYPHNANVFKEHMETAHFKNSIEGINDSIANQKNWLKENKAVLKKLKGLDDCKFVVTGDPKVVDIIKNPEFQKKLAAAIKDYKQTRGGQSQGR